jgi:two-component system invasion response regulator UvrY
MIGKTHKITALVVDDHEVVRNGIVSILNAIGGVNIVAEASSGEEAIKIVQEKRVDIVFMDIRMPGIGGLQATINILRISPKTKIVVLTVCNDELFPTKLLQVGSHGYLTKNTNKDEVNLAIEKVMAGGRYISPDIASKIVLKQVSDKGGAGFSELSERELQVAMMITSAHKVQEISEVLCLSPKTVNSYRYRIFEKLQVKNDVELTRMAYKYGLLDMHDSKALEELSADE